MNRLLIAIVVVAGLYMLYLSMYPKHVPKPQPPDARAHIVVSSEVQQHISPPPDHPSYNDSESGISTSLGINMAELDWPPSDTLNAYKSAQKLYQGKNMEEGLRAIRGLVSKTLILAPEGGTYTSSAKLYVEFDRQRLMPTQSMLDDIWYRNGDYAYKLLKQGKLDQAVEVLTVNLQLCKAMIEASPHTVEFISSGNQHWQSTWGEIAGAFYSKKRNSEMKAATDCGFAAQDFSLLWLNTERNREQVERERTERKLDRLPKDKWDRFKNDRKITEAKIKLAAADRLAKQWNKDVYTPECRSFISKWLR